MIDVCDGCGRSVSSCRCSLIALVYAKPSHSMLEELEVMKQVWSAIHPLPKNAQARIIAWLTTQFAEGGP